MLRSITASMALLCACNAPQVDLDLSRGPVCAQTDARAIPPTTNYHGDAARLGWNDAESILTPEVVRRNGLEPGWVSARFDEAVIDGVAFEPMAYAAPLHADDVRVITADGTALASMVLAATSNGWVYATAAESAQGPCALAPGDPLWRTQVVRPLPLERLDGGVPMGVLSTPILDLEASIPRIYVVGLDAADGWQAFALALDDGRILDGWPVGIDDLGLAAVDTNGPARFWGAEIMSQRGALRLSPGGERLYVTFGTFWGEGAGWIVAMDTEEPAVVAAFSSAPSSEGRSNGGIWGSGGPAVDDEGRVWLSTGNSPPGSGSSPGVWGSSLLELDADLVLRRAYSPFNHCVLDDANMDLGASQPVLLPPLPETSTPRVVAFGGKQGNVYLVDRDALAVAGEGRAPCRDDASTDASLLPPEIQPQFGTRGPLNVFGPYSDEFGQIDHAKMRTKLAHWRDAMGRSYLFATGSTKAAPDSTVNVPPSIAKLRVVTPRDRPAWLEVEAVEPEVVFHNPGSPIVTSHEGRDGIVWVIDRNAPRTASLLDPNTPGAVVYAFDADTLELLWQSEPDQLGPIGKYGTPIVVRGRLIVASDRIQTFSLRSAPPAPGRDR
ncbi:serine protease family protein [Paraliomyxa miuraensis]|uniref:hypothetical protein n=1 Tax=Paraliomyxa miuraensis TaxID=376150 RepID=UPI00224E7FD1|nr:hypothetical protein [Paraliomyxa miuraensis]MCX4245276.1 hypothetical protein [Paraliomyxa miuraensis]